jgi:hypothetical protein
VAQVARNLGRTKFDKRSGSRKAPTTSSGMENETSILLRLALRLRSSG